MTAKSTSGIDQSLERIVHPPNVVRSISFFFFSPCPKECNVSLVSIDPVISTELDDSAAHFLAIITRNSEACLLVLKDQPGGMPPIVLKILGVTSNFQYTIAQAAAHTKDKSPAFMICFSTMDTKLNVIFTETKEMKEFLDQAKPFIERARKDKVENIHQWCEVYRQYQLEENQPAATPTERWDSIPYVLPVQQAQDVFTSRDKHATPIGDIKQHWLNRQLLKRQEEFVTWETVNIFASTWNVHGCLPKETLEPWLLSTSGFNPDFYVIGLQEMETNKDAYVRYDPAKENTWVKAILRGLGPKADHYYKVASQQLVTILVIVIAKKSLQSFIKDVSTNYVPVGFMNIMGNKGGVGIRLRFHDSYLCFIGCHLAAFTDQIDRRNQDFNEICKRLVFQHHPNPALDYVQHGWNDEGVSFLETHGVTRDWWDEASVFHADHLVWLGDLNYRINLTEPEIKARLRRQELDTLLRYDQLLIEKQAGRAFQMFDEGKIKFMPTYKFDAGTDQYDSSAKRRAPSWTDRILWKKNSATGPPLELLAYDSCIRPKLSDHKPVYAHMKAKIRNIDRSKLKETKNALAKILSANTDATGQGRISANEIDFENVAFMEYKERTVVLENTSQILAPFRLIPKPDETDVCPPWLQIYPKSGVLGPGDKAVIHLALMIDRTISTPFNEGLEPMATTLVVRMENISDFFIEVTGKYQPTCFGVRLERLALMNVPVAALTPNRPVQPTEPIGQQATLPKELWRVLNFLWNESMLCSRTLFFEHGDRVTAEYIRRCLDTGEQFDTNLLLKAETSEQDDPVGPKAMVDVLVAFLECLPEPVIPEALYTLAMEAIDAFEAMAELKERLPYIHLTVLLHLISFLQDAIRYAPETYRVARKAQIVHMFTVLLRPPLRYKEQNPLRAQQRREQFVDCIMNEGTR